MICALFDLDGTLADTEVLKAKALSEAIQQLGGNSPPEVYKNVMGKSWDIVVNAFFQHSNFSSTIDQLNPIFREIYSELIKSELIDNKDAARILSWFQNKNFKLGLISSASAAGIKVIGLRHGYNEFHDFRLCSHVFSSFDEYITAAT